MLRLINVLGLVKKMKKEFSRVQTAQLIEMAWADEIPFQAIEKEFGLSPSETVKFMRANMKRSSFLMWRKRTAGNKMKSKAFVNNSFDFTKSEYRRTFTDNKNEKTLTNFDLQQKLLDLNLQIETV